jgi:hypothetical protein
VQLSDATTLQLFGAGAFGGVIGWNLYAINRYRTDAVGLGDLLALIGAIGGAAILDLFPAGSDLFGAYGIGLGVGFCAYFATLTIMVRRSPNFNRDWFLDGRRKKPAADEVIPEGTAATVHPMGSPPDRQIGG